MRRNAFIGFLLVFAFLSGRAWAQPSIDTIWEKCLGGSQPDEGAGIVHTTDGGFAVVGSTQSNDDQVVGHHGGEDGWVVKLNSVGVLQWQKCLGGTSTDVLNAIIQTSDGGYAAAGWTYSSDGDVSGNHGGGDAWVVKLNDTGGIQWQKCLGGSGGDEAYSIIQTSDGGFAVAGNTTSDDDEVSGNHGNDDVWVVKLNDTGAILWQKCLGGSNNDEARSILQNADGGFTIAGYTSSSDGDVSGNHGGGDAWVVEINDTGAVEWQDCLGGTSDDEAFSIISTSDGGFAVAGYTNSNDGDVSGYFGNQDIWVVKLDLSGGIEWQKCLGGSQEDWAYSIIQTTDGGYAVAGLTYSDNDEVSGNFGTKDGLEWVVKLNDTGAVQWQKCLGGTEGDVAQSIIQIPGGDFVVAGTTASNDSDVIGDHGPTDIWVVELGIPPSPVISYITPDAGAPGMCVAVEIIGPADNSGNFGGDQIYNTDTIVQLSRPSDSGLVRLGPTIVSWNGREIQQMFMIEPRAAQIDTEIYFTVTWNGGTSAVDSFRIVTPAPAIIQNGGGTLLTNGRTVRNTLVVDSLILTNGTFTCPQTDPDPNTPGNQAYLPLRILSMGPIELSSATLSANGSNGSTGGSGGGAGGPGGGGGGSGYPGAGGAGFTGGGGDDDGASGPGGVGTGPNNSTAWYGGLSLDSAYGASGEQHSGTGGDDGGGGGTGHPFGTSGVNGTNTNSPAGGYGGASAGGSTSNYLTNYGGGGGGNEAPGGNGGGPGANAGQAVGNAMLIPLFGGSGGGAGNCTHITTEQGGSGGGGGGAIELTSFASFSVPNGSSIISNGGNGSNGHNGLEDAAGGGGGAGGAISISARDSIVIGSSVGMSENGGAGGTGQNSGGTGGVGRIRINGYVSKFSSPLSGNYFKVAQGYTGPSIQRVTYSADSFFVQGFAEYWDGVPNSPLPMNVYYTWPSLGMWLSTTATPVLDPASHTASWTWGDTLSRHPVDSELYIVAVQLASDVSDPYVDVPGYVMSHTSGIISKVTGPPMDSIHPTAINFGDVLVGKCSDDTTIEIYSIGKSALVVNSALLSGVYASQYKIITPLPVSLPPGDSLALMLQFCPDSTKCPMNATLAVAMSDTAKVIALTGCGVQPDMTIKPDTLNFGLVHVGTCKDSFVVVTDTGKDPLTITAEFISDPRFRILDNLPIIVPAGGSAQIDLEYCPMDTSITQTADTVIGDAPQSPVTIILQGAGKVGILSYANVFDFGDVRDGTCKDSVFYVKNVGNDTLLLESDPITSTGFTALPVAFPIVLQPNDSIGITLQFCSTDTGSFQATMTVGTDVPSSDSVLLLAHTGIGILQMDSIIDFGQVATGGCADTTVTIKNVGTDTLVLAPGTNFQPPFSYQGPPQIVLAPGASTTITLLFCPQDTNESTETTSFDTIGIAENQTFTLLGKGIQGSLSTAGFIDLGCVVLGTSATITDTIRNIGAATLQGLGAVITPVGSASIVHNPPASFPPGAVDSVVFVVPAQAIGPIFDTLVLSWTDGTSVKVLITGQVSLPPVILSRDINIHIRFHGRWGFQRDGMRSDHELFVHSVADRFDLF